MNELDLVQQDLKTIWRRLLAGLGEKAAAFQDDLLRLLRRLDRDGTERSPARDVRELILKYAGGDADRRIRVERLLERTTLLSAIGQSAEEVDGETEIVGQRDIDGRGQAGPRDILEGAAPTGVTPETPEFTRPANARHVLVPIWYATDRNHQAEMPPSKRYGAGRSKRIAGSHLQYGIVTLSIPDIHKKGDLESPAWFRLEFRENPDRHIMVRTVTELDHTNWMESLQERADQHDLLVFIHGYNTTWADASKRAAQISYDMNFAGRTVMYTWPSHGRLLGYKDDIEQSEWAESHFTDLLRDLLSNSGARRIHVIAHSMGNRVMTKALREIADDKTVYPSPLREIVFAAPDVDADHFSEFAERFNRLVASFEPARTPRLTLYICGADWALGFSKRVYHRNLVRAGDSRQVRIVALPMDTIEVTDQVLKDNSDDWSGHAYFCTNTAVLGDLTRIVVDGQRAADRTYLVRNRTREYWEMREVPTWAVV